MISVVAVSSFFFFLEKHTGVKKTEHSHENRQYHSSSLSTFEGMDPFQNTLLHGHRTPKVIMIPNGILMAHTSTMVQ